MKKLTNLYANKSRFRVMFLKYQLFTIKHKSRSVSEYLQELKGIANELSIIDTPFQDDDIVIRALLGISPECKELAIAIRARKNPISFEELHDKLVAYETYLKHEEKAT
ncbi:hypothetical protein EUGRSUZ_H00940 [Eucalyptus grandis]|uniref:Uncharacterized protein n=2 Tax=Eucalyptus grandis TaxID=71139 RepID=A0ACC3KBZ7_EUCGR|nr:hypothetical protein EUGRSUZ_H00940 [Eucalyptus grandis]